jgi:diacylglycerol kinase (ATP)
MSKQSAEANQTPDSQQKPNGTGLQRVWKATYCSILGFKAVFKHEAAFRQELLLFAILTPIAIVTADSLWKFVTLIASMLLVLIVEIVNSAVEAVVDRIGYERHELSGRAKDLGSAAVMLALLISGMVWFAHFYQLLKGE